MEKEIWLVCDKCGYRMKLKDYPKHNPDKCLKIGCTGEMLIEGVIYHFQSFDPFIDKNRAMKNLVPKMNVQLISHQWEE